MDWNPTAPFKIENKDFENLQLKKLSCFTQKTFLRMLVVEFPWSATCSLFLNILIFYLPLSLLIKNCAVYFILSFLSVFWRIPGSEDELILRGFFLLYRRIYIPDSREMWNINRCKKCFSLSASWLFNCRKNSNKHPGKASGPAE